MTVEQSNPTGQKLKTLVPRCALCGTNLSGHRFALIASTLATEDNRHRVQALISRVIRHEWSALTQYRDSSREQNAVLVYSITGPHDGAMVVLIRDPFEQYEAAELYLQEQLLPGEASVLTTLTPLVDWQNF